MGIFNTEEQDHIIHAITLAENKTSGEIRLAVERHGKTDAFSRATYFFNKLGMHQTSLRNGVLIYIAVEDHTFAIIGDQGINNVVTAGFWDETKALMLEHFRDGKLAEGLIAGIMHTGKQLKAHFPVSDDDINELPDDIIYGDL